MCGRVVSAAAPDVLAAQLAVDEIRTEPLPLRWNVAPTDELYAVVEHRGRRLLGALRWGLVPAWSPDAAGAARLINARAETLLERPAYREAVARRRCILPVDAFYEWRVGPDGARRPHVIHGVDGSLLALAGLWEVWHDPRRPDDAPLRTCTIVTTAANADVAPLHDRMPAILSRSAWEDWLDTASCDAHEAVTLLRPAPDGALATHAVGPRVNNVRNDGADLIAPVADDAVPQTLW